MDISNKIAYLHNKMKPDDEKTEEEKLMEDIAELKSRIKNTEYDLTHMFKNNTFLEQKLVLSKKSLEEKQKTIEAIKAVESDKGKDKKEELREKEDEIAETKQEAISTEQEAVIEEELEKEMM